MTSSYQEITARLKKRFHGIDSIIDKCVETVLVWKRDPHLFERPLVVNLWGATGTGKTSMVIEILRELGLFGRTLYLNFSDTDSVNDSLDIEEHIRDLQESHEEPIPPILIFDEFQHARTINEEAFELQMNSYSQIWATFDYGTRGESLREIGFTPRPALIFVIGNLDESWSGFRSTTLEAADEEHLGRKLGNISLEQIRIALSKRFRREQIARLGAIHFMFPLVKKAVVKKLLVDELTRITQRTASSYGIAKLDVDPSVWDFLLNRGQALTYGVRNVQSTVQLYFTLPLTHILSQALAGLAGAPEGVRETDEGAIVEAAAESTSSLPHRAVRVSMMDSDMQVDIADDGQGHRSFRLGIEIDQRKSEPSRDDYYSVTCVHEAGHAVVMIKLMGHLPDKIQVWDGVNRVKRGFVKSSFDDIVITQESVVYRMAGMLAGRVAEEHVYGADDVTAGAVMDIQNATELANRAVMRYGFYGTRGTHLAKLDSSEENLLEADSNMKQTVKEMLDEATFLAKQTIEENEHLFRVLIRKLWESGAIGKSELRSILSHEDVEIVPVAVEYKKRLRSYLDARHPDSSQTAVADSHETSSPLFTTPQNQTEIAI